MKILIFFRFGQVHEYDLNGRWIFDSVPKKLCVRKIDNAKATKKLRTNVSLKLKLITRHFTFRPFFTVSHVLYVSAHTVGGLGMKSRP